MSARTRGATAGLWKAGGALAGVTITVSAAVFDSSVRDEIGRAAAQLTAADPFPLAGCAALTASALCATAFAWRSGIVGGVSRAGACARYGTGCLANSMVPGHLGGALRTALFGAAVPPGDRRRALARCLAGTAAARWLALSAVTFAAAIAGELPRVIVAPALAVAATSASVLLRTKLGAVVLWMSIATLARVGAAAAGCLALGVERPVGAGLAVVAASGVAGVAQLTPANVGVAGVAIGLALHSRPDAVPIGLALHGVETLVGLLFGLVGTIALIVGENAPHARFARDRARRLRHDRGSLRRVGRVVRVAGDALA